jgi:proline-specific peptidase
MSALLRRLSLVVGAIACLLGSPAAARSNQFPAPEREYMVPVAGGRVYVRVNGPMDSARPPIILLHGGPGGTHSSLLDALELADERMVILYDQLGSGRSDPSDDPANWTVERFTGEIDAIRRALGVKRWYVLGHSWGGTLALEYGARRPAELAGLVLASPLISTRSWLADANALVGKLSQPVQQQIHRCESPKPPPQSLCDAATAQFYKAFNRREPASPALKAYRGPQDHGFNAKLYNFMWGASEFVSTGTLKSYNGEPLLAKLDGRHTLFLVGQYDEARPATAEMFSERVAGSEFAVVPGAAHGTFTDRPDETVAIVRAWLHRQDSAN